MKPNLPSSSAFWILSSGYRDAGDATLSTIQSGTYVGFAVMPCVFLYFRSIELGLKSILVNHQVPEREIAKNLGHRITDLLNRVEAFVPLTDLGITTPERRLLDRFSDDYANKWFEYSGDWWRNPQLEELQQLASRVCEASRRYGGDNGFAPVV